MPSTIKGVGVSRPFSHRHVHTSVHSWLALRAVLCNQPPRSRTLQVPEVPSRHDRHPNKDNIILTRIRMGFFNQNAFELYINGTAQHALVSGFLPSRLFATLSLL